MEEKKIAKSESNKTIAVKQTGNSKQTEKNTSKKDFKKIKITSTIVAILIVLGLIAYVLTTIVKKQNFSAQNPIAIIDIKDFGKIKVELYPSQAPETVANFVKLANNGFYDGIS